jgi:protein phosphatase PTC1
VGKTAIPAFQTFQIDKLAGSGKERRFSKEGGLLNRMFGGSNNSTKDIEASQQSSTSEHSDSPLTNHRKSLEEPEKRRRSSAASKATAFLANAKQSLHLSHTPTSSTSSMETPTSPPQSAMQRLGKTDPALSVPQGSLNNSAGESHPGPHSTFRVGVTEDKNKKCRRTMEDTHAYLYNFLSTPAPSLDNGEDASSKKTEERSPSPKGDGSDVIETDNGYFAIFDGHAGTFAADWCGKKLHVLLEDLIRKNPNSAIPEILDQTFTSVDQQLQRLPLKNSGCTAICAVLRWEDRIPNPQSATGSTAIAPIAAAVAKANESSDKANLSTLMPHSIQSLPANITPATALPKLQESATRQRVLYTANVGDARIVLCRNGKALRLSYDHKGSDENEGRRITNAGGLILNNRVNGVLAVTRALGDAYMKELITGHPYTTETVIQPDIDEFLILACDGVSVPDFKYLFEHFG